ncbi:aldehyde dehydrogenase family protein, partial [Streptomyces daliensis]|nr:aldehyde dehydrogenase family protein [Streptomyces daliensis]
MKTLGHWIGGKPVESVSGSFGPVYDPATGAQPTRVSLASAEEADAAVAAAREAYPDWAQSSLARRTAFLFRYRELLDAHRDEIAALITAE